MRVAVKHSGDVVSHERFFQTRGSKERKNLRRLAFYRGDNRRVVQHGNPRVDRSLASAVSSFSASAIVSCTKT